MKLHKAICPEALNSKACQYISRALQARSDDDQELYLFWTCLSLELIAKRALAKIHPSLVVDGTNDNSALAAVGHYHGNDIKTISCDIAFHRVSAFLPKKQRRDISAVKILTHKRNAELHSGEIAMKSSPLYWEGYYWRAAQSILSVTDESLIEFMRYNKVTSGVDWRLLLHIDRSKHDAILKENISTWMQLKKDDKDKRLESVSSIPYTAVVEKINRTNQLNDPHHFEPTTCPVCGSEKSVFGGELSTGGVSEEFRGGKFFKSTSVIFSPIEFYCLCCDSYYSGFHLDGSFEGYEFLPEEWEIGISESEIVLAE